MSDTITKADLEKLAVNRVSRRGLSRQQKDAIYRLLKEDIRENMVPEGRYLIKNYGNYRDLTIDPEYISIQALCAILDIAGYEHNAQ